MRVFMRARTVHALASCSFFSAPPPSSSKNEEERKTIDEREKKRLLRKKEEFAIVNTRRGTFGKTVFLGSFSSFLQKKQKKGTKFGCEFPPLF